MTANTQTGIVGDSTGNSGTSSSSNVTSVNNNSGGTMAAKPGQQSVPPPAPAPPSSAGFATTSFSPETERLTKAFFSTPGTTATATIPKAELCLDQGLPSAAVYPSVQEDSPPPSSTATTTSQSSSFCVRWRGFQGNLTLSLESARSAECFSDVTLACDDGSRARAHRIVLAAASAYFARALTGVSSSSSSDEDSCGGGEAAWPGSSNVVVVLPPEVDGEVLKALLAYMYVGHVFIPEDRLEAFFR